MLARYNKNILGVPINMHQALQEKKYEKWGTLREWNHLFVVSERIKY